jgi:hypothetical protein
MRCGIGFDVGDTFRSPAGNLARYINLCAGHDGGGI